MDNIKEIIKRLEKNYSHATAQLNFSDPFQTLIATILSAQCTDKRVNMITPQLFENYKNPEDYLDVKQKDLAKIIKSCGLYNSKSKNILAACKKIVDDFDGKVPDNIEDLMTLPGVGRKTANVVGAFAFGLDAIAVDTHVFRVSNRLGLADSKNVLNTEKDLMENIPKEKWSNAHHYLIWHGRQICSARKPDCENCFLNDICKYNKNNTGS